MSQNNNLQILPFYDSLQKQNHKKWWTYDKVFGLVSELDKLPPFQIQKATGGRPSSLILIDYETQVETDILTLAETAGLHKRAFTDYDLIIYPSTLLLGITNVQVGYYYLRITYDGITQYSEVFQMCADVSHLIKMEYWHNSDFCYPGGHIEYTFPYKTRIYIPSDIGKPSLIYEEQVQKREGRKFPVQQISYILHKFLMLAPEYLVYALRVARMHDSCFITYDGYEYDVDELLMTIKEWKKYGDLAELVMEFNTDTIVVTNARGYTDLSYEAVLGTCVSVYQTAVAKLVTGTFDYNNFQYTSVSTGLAVPLQVNDYVIIEDASTGVLSLAIFATGPPTYVSQPIINPNIAWDSNENEYYFAPLAGGGITLVKPFISSTSNIGSAGLVFGECFDNVVVEIWVTFLDSGGNMQTEKRGQGLSALLLTTGIPFFFDSNILQVKLKVSSATCPLFSESEYFTILPTGIGAMIIETDNIVG